MKYFKWVGLATVFFLMGCANQGGSNSTWVYPPLAIPLQPSIQQELQIARLNQLLQRKEVAQNVRAQMFAERGRYLDSVGLADLARLDYERSLKLNPAQSEVFNVLGVYFTQMSDYDSAFDAFDSSLELDQNLPRWRIWAVPRLLALHVFAQRSVRWHRRPYRWSKRYQQYQAR